MWCLHVLATLWPRGEAPGKYNTIIDEKEPSINSSQKLIEHVLASGLRSGPSSTIEPG